MRLSLNRPWVIELLILLALLILWLTPLPEILLGRWLLLGNERRDGVGRAHDRLALMEEGNQQRSELQDAIELRQLAASAATSLPVLMRSLDSYPVLEQERSGFLALYSSLGSKQQDMLFPASSLIAAEEAGWARARFRNEAGRLRIELLDRSGARIDGCETSLLELSLARFELVVAARVDSGVTVSDALWEQAGDSVADSLLSSLERQMLDRLLLDHSLRVKSVIRSIRGGFYIRLDERSGRDLLMELPAPPVPADFIEEEQPKKGWFSF
jgi:hypothetical protein